MLLRLTKLCSAGMKFQKSSLQPLSPEKIDACRAMLGMPADRLNVSVSPSEHDKSQSQSSLADKASRYLQERPNFNLQKSAISNWSTLRPLDYEIEILATKKSFKQTQQLFLTTTISQWATKFLSEGESAKPILQEFLSAFSSLLFLIPLNTQICLLYLKIYFQAKLFKVSKDKCASQLRYIFDWMLKQNKLIDPEFLTLFMNQHVPHTFYYAREKEIINFVYENLPHDFQSTRKHYTLLGNVLHGFTVHPWMPASLIAKLPALQKHHSIMIRFKAFIASVELLQIDSNDLKKPEYIQIIRNFTSDIPDVVYSRLARLFYYADYWSQTFWLGYFKYMGEGLNWKKQSFYHHFVIDDLLTEGIAGQQVKKAGIKFREQLKEKGVEIKSLDIRKNYEEQYGKVIEDKTSLQLQIANSLRLICGAEVLTEVTIKYFIVDILVDKKIIVQINSDLHYREFSGQKVLNLKSQFRERVMKRLGYHYIVIRIEDYTNSSFSMLEYIDEIIKQTKILGQVKKNK